MRLLNANTGKLEEFVQGTPSYAILSHTWGEEEVLFKDANDNPRVKEMQGYRKIQHLCEQALNDGLDYAWCDTCCIDKSSSAELSEAINSMFSYYRHSRICYVYLDDVDEREVVEYDLSGRRRWDQLTRSRWFSRGWTLQELIAPTRVIFFDQNWTNIGSRNDNLLPLICHITSIPGYVFSAASQQYGLRDLLRTTSIAARMSWASLRTTSRIEDKAYCLLGIFDINMTMLYGEGEKAFIRLQEEIIRISTDHSIFAWNRQLHIEHYPRSNILAGSPSHFIGCGSIQACHPSVRMESYAMTNRGLTITLPVINGSKNKHRRIEVALNCTVNERTQTLHLEQTDNAESKFSTVNEYTVAGCGWMETELDFEQSSSKKRTLVIFRQFSHFSYPYLDFDST